MLVGLYSLSVTDAYQKIPIYTLTWPCSKISSNSGFRDTVIPYQTNPDSTVQPCQQPPNSESVCVCVNCDTFHVHLPLCSHALFSNPPKYPKLISHTCHISDYMSHWYSNWIKLTSLISLIVLYTINHYIPMMVGVQPPLFRHIHAIGRQLDRLPENDTAVIAKQLLGRSDIASFFPLFPEELVNWWWV